jgi:ubiquinone/menaquinone biosynthesis C-methylase UbiE
MLKGLYVPRLLEVGYGSGIFMPELSRYCRELYGVDPHRMNDSVTRVLAQHGVHAALSSHHAQSMPFEDDFFDCVVAVSVMEFIEDADAACSEIGRVLTRDGAFLVVTPGNSRFVDAGLRVLTGNVASAEYGNRRDYLIDRLTDHFSVDETKVSHLPGLASARLYIALKLLPKR